MVAHPLTQGRHVFDFYQDFTSTAPDELTTFFALVHGPDGLGHKLVLMPLCHCGTDAARVENDLRSLQTFGHPVFDDLRSMPYPVVNTLIDDGYPRGALNYWKSAFIEDLSDEVIDVPRP